MTESRFLYILRAEALNLEGIMKKYVGYIFLMWIAAMCMTPFNAFSYDNLSPLGQPGGFRGVNWGSSKSSHQYLFSVHDELDGVETFHRELENLTFGRARLSEITYHFYHDKFYQVSIRLESETDHQPLLDILTESYGKPGKESGLYIWENDTVSIRLFSEGASIAYLPILNKIIDNQINE